MAATAPVVTATPATKKAPNNKNKKKKMALPIAVLPKWLLLGLTLSVLVHVVLLWKFQQHAAGEAPLFGTARWLQAAWKQQHNSIQRIINPLEAYLPQGTPLPEFKTTKDDDDNNDDDSNNNNQDDNPPKPLNVVLLYADDWRHDSLGIAGNPIVQTPFLDQLARDKGIRFTHNCVTTSICWISRATLHTGQYASQHKGWMPEEPYWYRQWYHTFPYLMNKVQNYFVGHVGKWDYEHFHEVPQVYETYGYSRIYSRQHWYTTEQVETEVLEQLAVTKQQQSHGTTPSAFDKQKYKINIDPETGAEQIHATDRITHDALEFLQTRPRDQPFMLTAAYFPPHVVDVSEEQWYPQPETLDVYDQLFSKSNTTLYPLVPPTNDIAAMNASWSRLPPTIFEETLNEARTRWHTRFDSMSKYDVMMKRYYRMITGVDRSCEQIYQELEHQNLLNDTLIIFTTDNGFYHGEHGLAGKWYPHEESIRIPLILVDPRAAPETRGTTRDDYTLNIDLAPTLLGAARIPKPSAMEGHDMAELYLAETSYPKNAMDSTKNNKDDQHNNKHVPKSWRTEFYYEHPQFFGDKFIPASTALVRKTHKYIQWGTVSETLGTAQAASTASNSNGTEKRIEQLFDLTTDPREEQDVSRHPQYASILEEMRHRHDQLQQECCNSHHPKNGPESIGKVQS